MLVSVFLPYLFQFVPLYRQDECIAYMYDRDNEKTVYKYNLTLNQVTFEIVHWFEMCYMYYITKKLMQLEDSKLNIKNELAVATFSWVGFSIVYFFTNLYTQVQDQNSIRIKFYRCVILIAFVARNLVTFYASCMLTLYTITFRQDLEDEED